MDPIRNFVKRLFKNQPPQIETEEYIIQALSEKLEDLKDSGLSDEEALNKTIMEFGDAEDFYLPTLTKEKKRFKRLKTIEHYTNDLVFASLGAMLSIAIVITLNTLYITDYGPWSAVVSIGILFWPLSIFYRWLNKRR